MLPVSCEITALTPVCPTFFISGFYSPQLHPQAFFSSITFLPRVIQSQGICLSIIPPTNCQLLAISINNTPKSTVVSKYMSFLKITLSKRSQMTVYALFTEKRDMPICLKRRIHTIRILTEYYIFDCMTSDRKKKLRMKTPRQRTKLKIKWAPN